MLNYYYCILAIERETDLIKKHKTETDLLSFYWELCNAIKMNIEVPWFERNLDFGKPKELLPYYLERLGGTIARIEKKLRSAPDDLLSKQCNGKWSVKENVGHLAEVDEIANKRIDEMVNGISPMSSAVFEPRNNYNEMSVEQLIEHFTIRRHSNLKKYSELRGDDLDKKSLHPRLKVMMSPVDLAWFDAEHDDHHLVKINFILNQA